MTKKSTYIKNIREKLNEISYLLDELERNIEKKGSVTNEVVSKECEIKLDDMLKEVEVEDIPIKFEKSDEVKLGYVPIEELKPVLTSVKKEEEVKQSVPKKEVNEEVVNSIEKKETEVKRPVNLCKCQVVW